MDIVDGPSRFDTFWALPFRHLPSLLHSFRFSTSFLPNTLLHNPFCYWGWQATRVQVFDWLMTLNISQVVIMLYIYIDMKFEFGYICWHALFPKVNLFLLKRSFFLWCMYIYSNLSTSSLLCTSCLLFRKGWKVIILNSKVQFSWKSSLPLFLEYLQSNLFEVICLEVELLPSLW